MNIEIKTTSTAPGVITHEVTTKIGDAHEQVLRTVIDTKEEAIRNALMELGWSPPEKPEDPSPARVFAAAYLNAFMRNNIGNNPTGDRGFHDYAAMLAKMAREIMEPKMMFSAPLPPDAQVPPLQREPETVVFRFSPEAYNLQANGEVVKTRCANDQWPKWARDFYDEHETPKLQTNTKNFVLAELDAIINRFDNYSGRLIKEAHKPSARVMNATAFLRQLRNLFAGS